MKDDKNENMPLPYWANNPTARELLMAYKRLITGTPKRVERSTKISLSAVSVEAGFHRSMLNKNRYPELCRLVHEAKSSNGNLKGQSMSSRLKASVEANKKLRAEVSLLKDQAAVFRDQLVSLEKELIDMDKKLNRRNTASSIDSKIVKLK